MSKVNKRYNRIENEDSNIYLQFYGAKFNIDKTYKGFVKCKLLHKVNDSAKFPDQLYIITKYNNFRWFQPLTFKASLLVRNKMQIPSRKPGFNWLRLTVPSKNKIA